MGQTDTKISCGSYSYFYCDSTAVVVNIDSCTSIQSSFDIGIISIPEDPNQTEIFFHSLFACFCFK